MKFAILKLLAGREICPRVTRQLWIYYSVISIPIIVQQWSLQLSLSCVLETMSKGIPVTTQITPSPPPRPNDPDNHQVAQPTSSVDGDTDKTSVDTINPSNPLYWTSPNKRIAHASELISHSVWLLDPPPPLFAYSSSDP
jgi:hypothetical protein